MRIRPILFGLIAWLAASPALADVTLLYAREDDSARRLTIEADEQGRLRAEDDRGQIVIIQGGEAYLIQSAGGERTIARLDDFMAVTMEVFRSFVGDSLRTSTPSGYALEDRGAETVGRWHGTLYVIRPTGGGTRVEIGTDDTEPGNRDFELVVSDDPTLARAGRAARPLFETLLRLTAMAFGSEPPQLLDHARNVLARGAVLRMTRRFVLQDVTEGPVAASRFDLPGPVLNRDALRTRMLSQSRAPESR